MGGDLATVRARSLGAVRPRRAGTAELGSGRQPWHARWPPAGGGACGELAGQGSDVEPEGAQLLAAVVGDLVRAPRRHPDPVDLEVADDALGRGLGLLLDDVGERAGGRGEGHVQGGDVGVVDVDAVDQAQVDHVDAQFGVDDVVQGLADLFLGGRLEGAGGLGHALSLGTAPAPASVPDRAWAVASFQAIQLSSAHLTRAGYLETPANATASSSTSSIASSGWTWPRDCISSRKVSWIFRASAMSLPTSRSLSTEALAWLMEQPWPSYEMSPITVPSIRTRRVISSPQVGLTWCTSAWPSRRPRP